MSRILVIKLGALGDVVQALGPIAAIRRHHRDDRVTLLTTAPYAGFLAASPYVDEVWVDHRPRPWSLAALGRLRRQLREGGFDRVYDLQTSDRSSWYFALMLPGRRPEWSGIARGCSHPHANPARDRMHTIDRQRDQLSMAGIPDVPAPDLAWATAEIDGFGLTRPFGLLVPGGSAHRPEKRWPAERYAALARRLAGRGIQPVVLGGLAEGGLARRIVEAAPGTVELTGRTDLATLATLARDAASAVGNDTGPMHLLAAAGAPSTVLFSGASDPALTAPRGRSVTILRRPALTDLAEGEVAATVGVV